MVPIPENSSAKFERDSYAILVKRLDNPTVFDGETFSAVLGTADNTSALPGTNDIVKTAVMTDALPNATVSVKVPPSVFDIIPDPEKCIQSDRIFYTIFTRNTLFLTPETDCDEFAIGSVVVAVDVNHCSNLSSEIELDFEELDEVSGRFHIYRCCVLPGY